MRIREVQSHLLFDNNLFVRIAARSHAPQEYTGVDEWLNAFFMEPLEFKEGCLHVRQRPGIGLELDEAAFAKAVT